MIDPRGDDPMNIRAEFETGVDTKSTEPEIESGKATADYHPHGWNDLKKWSDT
jgi:hypothetical protein